MAHNHLYHHHRRGGRAARLAVAFVLASGLAVAAAVPVTAAPNNNSAAKLTKAVTLEGVTRHLEAFQDIADAHGDRAAGRPGYEASVDYVAAELAGAGYTPTVQEFDFTYAEADFEQVAPDQITFDDFAVNGFTLVGDAEPAAGEATAPLEHVTASAGSPGPGCDAADFAGFTAGNIALIQRGGCGFAIKVDNAAVGGAAGVVVYNNVPDLLVRMIGDLTVGGIPAIFTTLATGSMLATDGPRTVHVNVLSETRQAWNVIAQTAAGRTDNVVMAGAHLDSVQDGAGINDNGTGSAALLETAVQMAKVKPNNAVRFAWWGAEESGLLGSEYYVDQLSEDAIDDIALYLNFDMVGSPNYKFGVYDGDNSGGTAPPGFIPPGSAEIEDVFEAFYAGRGLPFEDSEFSGRSDYGAFIAVGIPAGGLFTGAEVPKTVAQQAMYGGLVGEALDPCYHDPCDSMTPIADGADPAVYAALAAEYDLIGNVNAHALDVNADAIATSVITFAFDTSSVNGERSPGRSHGRATPPPFTEEAVAA